MTHQLHHHLPEGRLSHLGIERLSGNELRVPVVEGHIIMWPDTTEKMQIRRRKLRSTWQLGLPQWREQSVEPTHVVWVDAAELRSLAHAARAADDKGLPDCFQLRSARNDGLYGLWFNDTAAFMHQSLTPQTLDELARLLDSFEGR